jgi:hypothetical protein
MLVLGDNADQSMPVALVPIPVVVHTALACDPPAPSVYVVLEPLLYEILPSVKSFIEIDGIAPYVLE